MDNTLSKYRTVFIYLVLVLTTLIAFWQLHTYDFIVYDDSEYVTENEYVRSGLTGKSIRWAFTNFHFANWHPLTSLSFMLDYEFFESQSLGCHLTNVLLHIANTLLLFGVLKRMTSALWCSAFVAALFALHPLQVESVAWVSERKGVLSTFFWMLTMWAYVRYTEHRRTGRYLLVLLFFVLGLMSKPMLLTMPFVLLLLDYWPLGRLRLNSLDDARKTSIYLVAEKIPLFVLTSISLVVSYMAQQSGGAIVSMATIPLKYRLARIPISYIIYIIKMIWPARLAVFYPLPEAGMLTAHKTILSAAVLLLVTGSVIWRGRRQPYLPVGWFWYLGTLVPVIGLIQIGSHAMADRYAYVPLIGLFIMVSWGASELLSKLRYKRIVPGLLSLMVLSVLTVCSSFQVRHWRDGVGLFRHALEVVGDNSMIHDSLGVALQSAGDIERAAIHYHKALVLEPDNVKARNNLGAVLQLQGRFDEAMSQFLIVLQYEPSHPNAHYNLAGILKSQGKLDDAAKHYREVLRFKPQDSETHRSLGKIYASQGAFDEAIHHYRRSLEIEPDDAEVHNNLGVLLKSQGKIDEAIVSFRDALKYEPELAEAHNNLGVIFALQGRLDEAISHFRRSVATKPNNAGLHYNLGNALRHQGRIDEAASHYRRVLEIDANHGAARSALDKLYERPQ